MTKSPSRCRRRRKCYSRAKTALLPHQIKVVDFIHSARHRGLVVIHKAGTGKTLTASAATYCFLAKRRENQALILTPASLIDNFRDDFIEQFGGDDSSNRNSFFTRVTIMSHEMFRLKSSAVRKRLCAHKLLIIDEAHRFKTNNRKTSHAGICCSQLASKILLFTGTPIIDSPVDMKSLFDMVGGPFMHYYEPPPRIKNLYFPKPVIRDVFIDKPRDHDHTDTSPVRINWIERFIHQRIKQIRRNGGTGGKLKGVVFLHHIDTIVACARMLQTKFPYLNLAAITGEVSLKNRSNIKQAFNDNRVDILFITRAGTEGINLKGTSFIIMAEPVSKPALREQIIARGVRFNSHAHLPPSQRTVEVYTLHVTTRDINAYSTFQQKDQAVHQYIKSIKQLSI